MKGNKMVSNTYREIKDQYNRLKMTHSYLDENIDSVKDIYDKYSFIVYIGCGSSYSLAKSIAASTMTILKKKAIAMPAGDIMMRAESYKDLFDNALIVALSRSGSTSEILVACDELERVGANFRLLSISCREKTELAKISNCALEMPWAFDESVCQTSSVSNLYFAGVYMLAKMSDNTSVVESLLQVIYIGENFLNSNEKAWKNLAKLSWDNGVTLADAEISGICEEGSLTFKEICQLPSNHYSLLDSRHGPIVVMNERTLIIAALSEVDNKFERDLIIDMVNKGCIVITVSTMPIEIEGAINFNLGRDIEYVALGIPFVNIAQMITYYKAVERKVNPDEPTGLDAWIEL